MALRSTPPFRGDHVGSLLRPPALLEARQEHAAGEIDDAALRDAEDAAIRDVVAMQRAVGLQTVTDGEFRRSVWRCTERITLAEPIFSDDRAIAAKPDGMVITTHMCRGNFQSSWAAEGGYDQVAETLLTTLDIDGFFMEFDDERSGTFEPLRHLPEGKVVVLELMTTKTGELEDPEVLKARIGQATEHVPLEHLCLSPQCGFSSTVEGNELTVEQQAAKLRLIVDLAEEVWR